MFNCADCVSVSVCTYYDKVEDALIAGEGLAFPGGKGESWDTVYKALAELCNYYNSGE